MTRTSAKRDPYATLGVKQDASAADVRRAYRRKAKATHPDSGGSAEAFAEVRKAHDVLIDPVRRLTFDQTGDVNEPEPDNGMATAIGIIHAILDGIVAKGSTDDFARVDLIAELLARLKEGARQVAVNLGKNRNDLKKIEKLSHRFHRKQGDNFIRHMLNDRAANARGIIAAHELELSHIEIAKKLLADFRFDFDKPSPPARGDRLDTLTFTMSFARGI